MQAISLITLSANHRWKDMTIYIVLIINHSSHVMIVGPFEAM